MHFRNVAIEAIGYEIPPSRVSSSDLERRLNGTVARLGLPPRPIELLTGIEERAFWAAGVSLDQAAAAAGQRALDAARRSPVEVGLLVNTSVSREQLEPSLASLVHGHLGLSPRCRSFDVSNACLGFINGMELAGQLIDAGVVDRALVVDAENATPVVEETLSRLTEPGRTPAEFWEYFATLTLGSVAVAMVLGRADRTASPHRMIGSVSLSDTGRSDLCVGSMQEMRTDGTALLKAGVELASRTWNLAEEELKDWSKETIAQYICHQVGQSHMNAVCQALGIDPARCFLSFPRFGNVGPAAVPLTLQLAAEAEAVKSGDHVALMGIGSGLNVGMMSVRW